MKKYYAYYQPNDKDIKDNFGDCQIRALSKVLGLSWLETFDKTVPICRKAQTSSIFCGGVKHEKVNMAELGFSYTGISNKKGSKRPTVRSFAQDHPNGRFVVTVAHHVVAVVDGKYYDTWDSGNCSLYGYYTWEG